MILPRRGAGAPSTIYGRSVLTSGHRRAVMIESLVLAVRELDLRTLLQLVAHTIDASESSNATAATVVL